MLPFSVSYCIPSTAAVDGIQYETEKGSILCLAPDSYYLTNGSFWRISSENLEIPPGLYTDKNGDMISIAERLHAEDIRTDRSEKMIDAILQEISAEMERSCIRTGDINDNDAFDYLRYIDRNSGTVTLQRFADQYGFTEQYASVLWSYRALLSLRCCYSMPQVFHRELLSCIPLRHDSHAVME